VLALIGPVFSSSCVAAASVAEAAGVPLVAPLAQQSGLDSLGRSIFQLSIIPETQGSALAEYATLVLGLETFAVLAPLSDYGWSFERAFTQMSERNGGTVVHKEWYVPLEAKDFRHQFEAIRQVGFSLMPTVSADSAMFDSLSFVVLDSTIDGDDLFLELLEKEGIEAPADSSELFINSIDGVVVVGESFEDILTIVPQLRFHRLETQVMGNEVWNAPEQMRHMSQDQREYLKGSVFVSGRSATRSTRDFVDTFRSRFRSDPGNAAAGYDAAKIIITGWEAGHRSRGELREWLAQLRRYEGVGGWISFSDGRRSNSELSLLKIDGRGQVQQLQELPEISLPIEDLPSADLWDLDADLDSSASDSLYFNEDLEVEPAGLGEDLPALEVD
jgi:branched-chain amino acid transport system substrate-binding protein